MSAIRPQEASLGQKLPPTEYEQRAPHYEDLKEVLTRGFLSCPADIGPVRVNFRSFTASDFYLLRQRSKRIGKDKLETREDTQHWMCWFLATAMWMVDGQILLGETAHLKRAYDMFRALPNKALLKLCSMVTALVRRANQTVNAVESFCLEEVSRSMWIQNGSRVPDWDSFAGLPNARLIGVNYAQKMWIAYNYIEDMKLAESRAWSHSKLVASAQNPKGIKKLDMSDKSRQERETESRNETMDLFYYRTIGIIDDDDTLADGTRVKRKKKSYFELAEEYRKWVEGDEDLHDRVVREYKEKIMLEFEARQQADQISEQEQVEVRQGRLEGEIVGGSTGKLVAYRPEDLEKMLSERGRERSSAGTYTLYADPTPQRAKVYRDYLHTPETMPPPEGLKIDSKGRFVPNTTLQDQITNRRPTVETKDE